MALVLSLWLRHCLVVMCRIDIGGIGIDVWRIVSCLRNGVSACCILLWLRHCHMALYRIDIGGIYRRLVSGKYYGISWSPYPN